MTSPSYKGFAKLPLATRLKLASSGGKAAARKGTAHKFTPEEASLASKVRWRKAAMIKKFGPLQPDEEAAFLQHVRNTLV